MEAAYREKWKGITEGGRQMEAADREKWKGITEDDDKWRLPIGRSGKG